MIAPGIHRLPEAEYRAADAAANSDLKLIARSPAHFYAARLDPEREPEQDTPAKLAGRALHCAILEPHDFDNRFIYVPDDAPKDLRHFRDAKTPGAGTIASCQWWDEFTNVAEGKSILPKKLAQTVRIAGQKIASHPEVAGYLRHGTAEDSIFGNDPVTGQLCKIRTDWRAQIDGMNVIIDLKSTDDARPDPFSRSAYNYGYFQGAAFYCDVHEWAGLGHVDLYLLLAFEKDNPTAGVKVYEVTGESLDFGRKQYRRALDLYAHCREHNEWPGYSPDIEPLNPPAWVKA